MDLPFVKTLEASRHIWGMPVEEEETLAHADTSLGKVSLVRAPSASRTPDAVANKYEDWKLMVNGVAVAELYEVSAPVYSFGVRLKKGVRMKMGDRRGGLRLHDSLFSSRRSVEVSFSGHAHLRFRRVGLFLVLEGESGELMARKSRGRWSVDRLELGEVFFSVCFFEFSGVEHFLRNPILRNL